MAVEYISGFLAFLLALYFRQLSYALSNTTRTTFMPRDIEVRWFTSSNPVSQSLLSLPARVCLFGCAANLPRNELLRTLSEPWPAD
jgi:hypothetical protein